VSPFDAAVCLSSLAPQTGGAEASPLLKARALVTGGAGFIGSFLSEKLHSLGVRVTVVDSMATGRSANLASISTQVDLMDADLSDVLRTGELNLADYDIVYHLAANPYIPPSVDDPVYDATANLWMTLTLLEALRALDEAAPRLVYASSAAVYGNPTRLPISETNPTVPIAPYGVSKLAAERYVAVYSELYGIRANSLRLFSVYGPRQRKQVIYDLARRLAHDPSHLEVVGDGTQARDFVYVEDVVQAFVLAATVAPARGEVYNVATGMTHTIADLVEALCDVRGVAPEIYYSGSIRPGDADRWEVDITRIKALGFAPKVPLRAGLVAIGDWIDDSPE